MMDVEQYQEYLASIGVTMPQDIENCLSAQGIEIRVLYEDEDEHEGYYHSIDDAIEALNELRKLHPQLSNE